MPITTPRAGSFCTAVLRTRDLERAAAFYNALVGWTTEDAAAAAGHRLVQHEGSTVASFQLIADGEDAWVPHVLVEDIDRTLADAVALHATVIDAAAVPGVARVATVTDPEGALFGLWQPTPHQGASLMDEVGSLWWIEVLTNDVAGARDFYGRLFGWTSNDTSFEPFALYTVFKRGDVQEGGILPIDPEWEVAPRWNSIFAVNDCDATIARAKSLGGDAIFVHTVPKHGRIGGLCDTGGASFVIRGPNRF